MLCIILHQREKDIIMLNKVIELSADSRTLIVQTIFAHSNSQSVMALGQTNSTLLMDSRKELRRRNWNRIQSNNTSFFNRLGALLVYAKQNDINLAKSITPDDTLSDWNKGLRLEVPFWLTALAKGKAPEELFIEMMSSDDDFYQLSFFLNQFPPKLVSIYFEKLKSLLKESNSSSINLGVASLLIAVSSLTQEQFNELEQIIDMNLHIDVDTEQLIAFAASSMSSRFNPQLITVDILQGWLLNTEFNAYAKVAVDMLAQSIIPLKLGSDIDTIFEALIAGPIQTYFDTFPFSANFYQVFVNLKPQLNEKQRDLFIECLEDLELSQVPNVFIKLKKIAALLGEGVAVEGWDGIIANITPEKIIKLSKHEGGTHPDDFVFNDDDNCCAYLDEELCTLTDDVYLKYFTPLHINALLEVAINALSSSSRSTTYYSSYAILRLGPHLTTEQISRAFTRGLINSLVNSQDEKYTEARLDLLLYCILHKNANIAVLKNCLNVESDLLNSNQEIINLLSDVINYVDKMQNNSASTVFTSPLYAEQRNSFFKTNGATKRKLEESTDETLMASIKFRKEG